MLVDLKVPQTGEILVDLKVHQTGRNIGRS